MVSQTVYEAPEAATLEVVTQGVTFYISRVDSWTLKSNNTKRLAFLITGDAVLYYCFRAHRPDHPGTRQLEAPAALRATPFSQQAKPQPSMWAR